LAVLSFFSLFLSTFAQAPRTTRCVIPSNYVSSNGQADDSPAISSAFLKCSKDATIVFSEAVDYNVFKPITANLNNVAIEMRGNLHLPKSIKLVQSIVAGGAKTWFTISGRSIDYIGTADIKNGWINSYGQAWWDANHAAKGTGLPNRPRLLSFTTTDGTMQYFKSRKPIGWNVGLSGKNITVTNPVIDAESNSTGFPFNTDAFGVSGKNIRIFNMSVFNGDDAVAVQSGAHDVFVQGGTIGYQTHGLSIGSLGGNVNSFADVSNIWFDNITVKDAVYAARFKSWIGGKGIAKNVTWSNIHVENVTFPIFVTQTYFNQGTSKAERPNDSSVMMEDFTFSNFTGTINSFKPGDGSCVTEPCWYNAGLPNLKHTEAVIITCNTEKSCRNFTVKDIKLTPQKQEPASVICLHAKAELNPKLGFECSNGTFTPR
jgi:polygalacturonase